MTTTKISLEKFRFEIRIKESWDSFFSLFIPKSKKWHFKQIEKWRRFQTKSGQTSKWRLLVISCQKFEESCEYIEEKIHRTDVNPGELDDWTWSQNEVGESPNLDVGYYLVLNLGSTMYFGTLGFDKVFFRSNS